MDLSDAMMRGQRLVFSVVDPQRRVICRNRAAASLTGISEDQDRGRVFLEKARIRAQRESFALFEC